MGLRPDTTRRRGIVVRLVEEMFRPGIPGTIALVVLQLLTGAFGLRSRASGAEHNTSTSELSEVAKTDRLKYVTGRWPLFATPASDVPDTVLKYLPHYPECRLGTEPCDCSVSGVVRSPFLRSVYYRLYVQSRGILEYHSMQKTAAVKTGNKLSWFATPSSAIDYISKDFMAAELDSQPAVEVAIDAVTLANMYYPILILDSLRDVSVYADLIRSESFWNRASRDTTLAPRISKLRLVHVCRDFAYILDFPNTQPDSLGLTPLYRRIRPPCAEKLGDGSYRITIFTWSAQDEDRRLLEWNVVAKVPDTLRISYRVVGTDLGRPKAKS
jgi:hypothetical protein